MTPRKSVLWHCRAEFSTPANTFLLGMAGRKRFNQFKPFWTFWTSKMLLWTHCGGIIEINGFSQGGKVNPFLPIFDLWICPVYKEQAVLAALTFGQTESLKGQNGGTSSYSMCCIYFYLTSFVCILTARQKAMTYETCLWFSPSLIPFYLG